MVASKESYLAPCEADGTTMKMTHFVAAILVDLSCKHELSLFSGQKSKYLDTRVHKRPIPASSRSSFEKPRAEEI
jgi:hypothetical protein